MTPKVMGAESESRRSLSDEAEAPEEPAETFRPSLLRPPSACEAPRIGQEELAGSLLPEWRALRDSLEVSMEQQFRRQERVILGCFERFAGRIDPPSHSTTPASGSCPASSSSHPGGSLACGGACGASLLATCASQPASAPSARPRQPQQEVSEVWQQRVEASVRHIEDMLEDKVVVETDFKIASPKELVHKALDTQVGEAEATAGERRKSSIATDSAASQESQWTDRSKARANLKRSGTNNSMLSRRSQALSNLAPIDTASIRAVQRSQSLFRTDRPFGQLVSLDSSPKQGGSRRSVVNSRSPTARSAAQKQHWQIMMQDRFHRMASQAKTSTFLDSRSGAVFRCLEWFMFLEEPPREGFLAKIVLTKSFEAVCAAVIVLNAIFAAYTTNYEIANLRQDPHPIILALEYCFLGFYMVELLLKLLVHRLYFFANDDMRWNIFDLFLVATSTYYQLASWLLETSGSLDLTYMRTLRIMKLARILRVIRVAKVFSELRLMLNSIIGSFISLFWSFAMLTFVFYIFGLIFVQGAASYLIMHGEELDSSSKDKINSTLGSVQAAMLSLYKATTGGTDWENIFDDPVIERMGFMNVVMFIFLIAFYQVALLNILTGVFVENALKLAQPDRETQSLEVRKREFIEVAELREICAQMDSAGSGSISLDELQAGIRSTRTRAHLQVLGLHIRDVEMFFEMLAAAYGTDTVDIEDFVAGCMRLKGGATSIDVQSLSFQLMGHRALILELFEVFEDRLNQVFSAIQEQQSGRSRMTKSQLLLTSARDAARQSSHARKSCDSSSQQSL